MLAWAMNMVKSGLTCGLVLASSVTQACAATEAVVYSFLGKSDGANPAAALIEVDGALYGTTLNGGSQTCVTAGCGTIFKVTAGGKESLLHSFEGSRPTGDGEGPEGGLVSVGKDLYGTTTYGGAGNGGAIFKVSKKGKESVLYSFEKGSGDGVSPIGNLIEVGGNLYGTTVEGGVLSPTCDRNVGCGTVFSVSLRGRETILHSFQGGVDGLQPETGLLDVAGILYGTTFYGGTDGGSSTAEGTVYSVTPTGAKALVYPFQGGADGAVPDGEIINVNGTLYGVASSGGTPGNGTVYAVTPSGNETTLYSFQGRNDGAFPRGALINVNGVLYGVTSSGGTTGNGTVFKITTDGVETVVYSFLGGSDGSGPIGGLVELKGDLYGVTSNGGSSSNCQNGCGTVFKVKP